MTNSARQQTTYEKLRAIDCSDKVEKKGSLTYLSWAWAVDKLLLSDPAANWEFGTPVMFGETMMVSCTVTAFGIARTCHLPVMDNRNKAITNPDAFQVNTGMQRCLVKAIALHGLGLYIYAGEDLPDGKKTEPQEYADRLLAAFNGEYPGATEEDVLANTGNALKAILTELNGNQDLYLAAWNLLDAPTRRGIKQLTESKTDKKAA